MAIRADVIEQREYAAALARDRELVLAYQAGQPDAFDELYRRYFHRLRRYCLRRVHDPHVAEELAQDAFLKALKAMPRFAGDRRFYAWMTVIAQRLCIDHHRRHHRVEPAAELDTGSIDADHDAIFDAVDHDHVVAALERVAPRHREVLHLREAQGKTYIEIADRLEVPVSTVEALLHRARKALKREYLAVSGSGLAALPLFGYVNRLAVRWRARVGAQIEQLGPYLVPAAGAMAAVGLAVAPLTPSPSSPTPAAATPAVIQVVGAAGNAIGAGIDDLDGTSSQAGVAPTALTAELPPVDGMPAPVIDLGIAQVLSPDDAEWARDQNAQQPVHIAVPGVVDVGLDVVELGGDIGHHVGASAEHLTGAQG